MSYNQNTLNWNRPQVAFATYHDDDDDYEVIWDEPRITPYDRCFMELRAIEAERDQLAEIEYPTADQLKELEAIQVEVALAKKRFYAAKDFADSEEGRRVYLISDWRANEGREKHNASRRQVRDKPNTKLKGMTEEQKKQRESDRVSDARWKKRQIKNGASEVEIELGLLKRKEERELKRNPDMIH